LVPRKVFRWKKSTNAQLGFRIGPNRTSSVCNNQSTTQELAFLQPFLHQQWSRLASSRVRVLNPIMQRRSGQFSGEVQNSQSETHEIEWPARDGFRRVPRFSSKVTDAVERVPAASRLLRVFGFPLFTLVVLLSTSLLRAQTSDEMFPFVISGLSAPASNSIVDMSWLNDKPAGGHGCARAKDGHFVDDRGKRIRFLASNFTFGSCFPDYDTADKLAARLARLSINCTGWGCVVYVDSLLDGAGCTARRRGSRQS
jgi:hypothetical protein